MKPVQIVATMDAICPSIKPYTTDRFRAGMNIKGPAMLFPNNGDAWLDLGFNLERKGVAQPQDHEGYIGISVFSFTDVTIPLKIVLHNQFTFKGYDYEWIPEGTVYRFKSDHELEWYGACTVHKVGP